MSKQQRKSGIRIKEHWQFINILLVIYDLFCVNFAYFAGLLLRFDFRFSLIPEQYFNVWKEMIIPYSIFSLLVIWRLRLYNSLWRFASYRELMRVLISSVLTNAFQVFVTLAFFIRMPISYYVFGGIFQFCLIIGIRFSYRFILLLRSRSKSKKEDEGRKSNVMLIGAGNAGQMIIHDTYKSKKVKDVVRCIIDDNSNKWGRYIDDVEIVGGRDDILTNVEKYNIDKIYIAIPSASAQDKKEILDICKEANLHCKM